MTHSKKPPKPVTTLRKDRDWLSPVLITVALIAFIWTGYFLGSFRQWCPCEQSPSCECKQAATCNSEPWCECGDEEGPPGEACPADCDCGSDD